MRGPAGVRVSGVAAGPVFTGGAAPDRIEAAPAGVKGRSLVTVAALTTSGNTDQLVFHLGLAKQNGASEEELIEAITHLAFYAGWPKAIAAMASPNKSSDPNRTEKGQHRARNRHLRTGGRPLRAAGGAQDH